MTTETGKGAECEAPYTLNGNDKLWSEIQSVKVLVGCLLVAMLNASDDRDKVAEAIHDLAERSIDSLKIRNATVARAEALRAEVHERATQLIAVAQSQRGDRH